MGVVIVERKHSKGTSWQVRWNRRRDDRPRAVYLGSWPEKRFAEAQRIEALYMLARTGTIDVDALRGRGVAKLMVRDVALAC